MVAELGVVSAHTPMYKLAQGSERERELKNDYASIYNDWIQLYIEGPATWIAHEARVRCSMGYLTW